MKDSPIQNQQNSNAQKGDAVTQKTADAPAINDSRAAMANDKFSDAGSAELAPEFGDAADPASEELGQHHRDE